MFYKSFSSFFRDINFIPFIYLPFYKIIFLFIVDNLNKLLSNFHYQVDKILRNFYYKIIKLNLKFIDKCILLETFIFIDVCVENWFWIGLTKEFFHFVRSYYYRIGHVKRMLLIKLKIVKTNLNRRLKVGLFIKILQALEVQTERLKGLCHWNMVLYERKYDFL